MSSRRRRHGTKEALEAMILVEDRVCDQDMGTCEEVAGGEEVGDPLQWRQHAVEFVRFLVVTELLHGRLRSTGRAALRV